jgi:uncharacterized protein
LHRRFELVYGTSTGAIIAALIALGRSIDEIHDIYKRHVPAVMSQRTPSTRTAALARLAKEVFQDTTFSDAITGIGVVTAKWMTERPMCSAYPFFERKIVTTAAGDHIELVDGGYCANNPTLYAIADAVGPLQVGRDCLRVLNVGVGVYPTPKPRPLTKMWFAQYLQSVQLLQKTLEINTQSMDQLRAILFRDIQTIRISDTFERPEMATDLLEADLSKLNILRQRGRESFGDRESDLHKLLK